MKVAEAAEFLEVSPGTVYALVAAGKLKCARIGMGRGCIRISEGQIADYLAGAIFPVHQNPTPPPKSPSVKLRHLHR